MLLAWTFFLLKESHAGPLWQIVGMDAFLSKPVRVSELLCKLNELEEGASNSTQHLPQNLQSHRTEVCREPDFNAFVSGICNFSLAFLSIVFIQRERTPHFFLQILHLYLVVYWSGRMIVSAACPGQNPRSVHVQFNNKLCSL